MKRLAAVLLILTGCAGVPGQSTDTAPSEKIAFRAAVMRGSGDLIPVSRRTFTASPYDEKEVLAEALKISNPGPSPAPVSKPLTSDADYVKKYEQWREYDSSLGAWKARAYSTREAADLAVQKRYLQKGLKPLVFETDLDGKAEINLSPGLWYFTGNFKLATQSIFWNDVAVIVSKDKKTIELSNDNGEIINQTL